MSHSTSNYKTLLAAGLIALAACSMPVRHSARNAVPTTFASPSQAGAALLAAARSGDRNALLGIFGPDGQEVLFAGDAARDAANLRGFVDAYTQMNRWQKLKAGGEVLYIGADNSAFPVPLGQNASGRWYFDTAAGKDEILARRIGKHELTAIAACEATANAQDQYFKLVHERGAAHGYASKLLAIREGRTGCTGRSRRGTPRARSARLAILPKPWLPAPATALHSLTATTIEWSRDRTTSSF